LAPDREQEPAQEPEAAPRTRLVELGTDESMRKGTDLFSVASPEATDTSLENLVASTVPPDVATPKDQASSE